MPVESVHAYLLGTLGDSEAAALEEKYFTDREFFLRVRAIEADLIQHYLEGRLSDATRELFENRYLRVPELRNRLEEVHGHLAASHPTSRPRLLRPWPSLVVAGAAAILIGGAFWLQHRFRVDVVPTPRATTSIAAVVRLSPGVLMGNSDMGRLTLPAEQGAILVQLDLPVTGTSVTCTVRLARIATDGDQITIWKAPGPVVSSQSGRRQQLAVALDRRLLDPGDYIVEVSGLDRPVQATYLFRAVAAVR